MIYNFFLLNPFVLTECNRWRDGRTDGGDSGIEMLRRI